MSATTPMRTCFDSVASGGFESVQLARELLRRIRCGSGRGGV